MSPEGIILFWIIMGWVALIQFLIYLGRYR